MKREKSNRTGISLSVTVLLFVAFAVIPYGRAGSVRSADQCDELLAKNNRLWDKARGARSEELEGIWNEIVKVIKTMRSLRCSNTPDVPISGSSSSEAMRGIQGPGGEGVAEYTVLPERRHWRGFLEKMQPPDSEAEGSCGDLSGRWQITTSEGSETWEIWKAPLHPRLLGGRKASDGDHANMWAVLLDGNILKLQFDTWNDEGEVTGGTYTCKLNASCRASLSECKLTYDRNREGSSKATFKWLGPLQRRQ